MITKLLVTLFVFSISVNALSSPVAINCATPSEISNEIKNHQDSCSHYEEISPVQNQHDIAGSAAGKETITHMNMRKRQPSLAESFMAMFFIPGLILLWFSRFTKSNK